MTPIQSAYRAVVARRTLPHGQRPSDLHVRIAFTLARWQHATPDHRRLARACHCHRNSVGAGLRRLRGLGLLTWERRFVRIGGGRFARASNRYLFLSNSLPAPVHRDKKNPSFLAERTLFIGDPAEARVALDRVRARMEQRLRKAVRYPNQGVG